MRLPRRFAVGLFVGFSAGLVGGWIAGLVREPVPRPLAAGAGRGGED